MIIEDLSEIRLVTCVNAPIRDTYVFVKAFN